MYFGLFGPQALSLEATTNARPSLSTRASLPFPPVWPARSEFNRFLAAVSAAKGGVSAAGGAQHQCLFRRVIIASP